METAASFEARFAPWPTRQSHQTGNEKRARLTEAINSRMDAYLRGQYWKENKPAELAPNGSLRCAGEGKLRTPAYENRKSVFIAHLQPKVIFSSTPANPLPQNDILNIGPSFERSLKPTLNSSCPFRSPRRLLLRARPST